MTQTFETVETTPDEYFAQAEDEIERFAASGGSPAVVSILSLLLSGVKARPPTASTTSTVTPTSTVTGSTATVTPTSTVTAPAA